ncbi:MAG TPA: Fe-S cluster assembly ATPase SufC [Myxococcota bacterium]|nr:Fe-S cluster assembly ATPase SufC [Myxococcota bacterium]HON24368.1 Fe-S cluster assembly ATPase SufC [Myxococcota bacterium]HOS61551.1 Fe-S cluster assembly ATPase SufC [Myxococcota bacterium]HPC91579.1 Fe-S cluster assembly ATPase SufC [Myxococcota bacterium]HPL24710.1 Fe-S cluster assembly ATPase SufC [Myxococcota bacterium]
MTENTAVLKVKGLHASIDEKPILKGVDLTVEPGEVHAIMGRNGSGKSTLANIIMGHPKYTVDSGEIIYLGENLADLDVSERARAGIFMAFQYPVAIPGVSVAQFLRTALRAQGHDIPAREFRTVLSAAFAKLGIPDSFRSRHVNDGFSGGEKKRLEILQLLLLKPKLALLDETDSGLDIDALRTVSQGVNEAIQAGVSVILVTHYQRILEYVKPDHVHVFLDGQIAMSGGPELAHSLEARGYDWVSEGQS